MLRRFLNAMGREAPVRLEHARSWEEAKAVLPEFIDAHVARFLATGRISNLAQKERRMFLAQLAQLMSESGWFALTTLMAGKKAFAWNYGFRFLGTWFWYQPTFDSDFEKYSPGFCLLAKLIEEAAEMPEIQTVDLGLGAEDYKDRFANGTRKTLHVTLTDSGAAYSREVVRYSAAAVVKVHPRVEAAVRSFAERLGRVKEDLARESVSRTFARLASAMRQRLWLETEVAFYEVGPSASGTNSEEMTLQPLDLHQLAIAAPVYSDDEQTHAYLLRSAARVRSGGASGFVMIDRNGVPLHFAWIATLNGFFLSALNTRVSGHSTDAVMLFDCWTPLALRGRGHCAQALGLFAGKVRAEGKELWTFSAATNLAWIRPLAKAGLRHHYSLIRRRLFWRERITKPLRSENGAASEEASARA